METDVLSFLLSQDSLSHLTGRRIYPLHLPKNPSYPAITFQQVSADHGHHLRGALGHVSARFQFDIWADDIVQLEQTTEGLRQTLDGYIGPMGTRICILAKLLNVTSFAVRPVDNSDSWLYRKSCDYNLKLTESVPMFSLYGITIGGSAEISFIAH